MQVHTFSNTYLPLRRPGAGVITRILEGTQMMQLETMTAPTKKINIMWQRGHVCGMYQTGSMDKH